MRLAPIGVLTVMLLAIDALAQDKGTIYYLSPSLASGFESGSRRAIESVCGELGYEVVLLDAKNRPEVQLRQLVDAAELVPDAVILNALDVNAVVPGIERARAAGVPVFNYNQQIPTTRSELTSIAAVVEIGRTAASEAIRLLTERYGEPKGTLLHIQGDPSHSYTRNVLAGFQEVMLQRAPHVELMTEAALGWDPSAAASILATHLSVNPDLDLVFCDAGHFTLPIVSYLQESGKEPGEILLIALGGGGSPPELDNIRAGWQEAAIEHPLYAQA